MTTGNEQRRDDEPLATALAGVRIATLVQRDVAEYAKTPGLPPDTARDIEMSSGRLLRHLQSTDQWVDQYAAANGVPATNYLLDINPKPYPQQGDLAQKVVWFATESYRLAENIHRRLGTHRTARAEQELQARAARADEPARLDRAAAQIIGRDPVLRKLLQQGHLPATRTLLAEVTAQQRQGKLHKRPPEEVEAARSTSAKRPRAEAPAEAERATTGPGDRTEAKARKVSFAVAAALAMPGEGRHLEHGKPVTEDRRLGLLNDATVGLGLTEAALLHNPWADAARQAPSEQRGRTPAETPAASPRTPARSPSPAPSRR
jgi:hypothetical protein